jgi:hypothetical protein
LPRISAEPVNRRMKRHSKLTSQDQQQSQAAEHQAQPPAPLEFNSPEELLRYDATRTPVPRKIAERLQESIGSTPARARSWWQRFFGASNT